MSREIQVCPQTVLSLLLFAVIVATAACGRDDARSEEKRILAEISRIGDESHQRLTSDEALAARTRLKELRQFFPDRRDEISTEAQAVKAQFVRERETERTFADLYSQLLALPLSDEYRNCVKAQKEFVELIGTRSQKAIDEMDVLLDPSVVDLPTLEARVNPILQRSEEIGKRLDELELSLREKVCRRPEQPQ